MNKTYLVRNFLYWLPSILYMALIFYLSSYPPPEPVKSAPIFFDIKLVHIIEYGILNLLLYWAIDKTIDIPDNWKIIYSIALTILYGLTDELHQVFVPGRSGRLIDIVANFFGCVVTQYIISIYKKRSYLFFQKVS